MKNTRRPSLLSNPKDSIQTSSGRISVPLLSHSRFDKFVNAGPGADSKYLQDAIAAGTFYEIRRGEPASGGSTNPSSGRITDFDIYGTTIYTDFEIESGVKIRAPAKQAGFALPIGGLKPSGLEAAERDFLLRTSASSLDPSALAATPSGTPVGSENAITYVIKLRTSNSVNQQALYQIGDLGAATSSFSIGYSAVDTLEIRHNSSGATNATQSIDVSSCYSKWTVLIAQAYVTHDGKPGLGKAFLYDLQLGTVIAEAAATTGDVGLISNSAAVSAIGYGEQSGGLNAAYTTTDFLIGVDIAEVTAIARAFSDEEVALIATSHLAESSYKSGINNRAPRKVQQMLDARRTYPVSSNPGRKRTAAAAFNDLDTRVFGRPPQRRHKEIQPTDSRSEDSGYVAPNFPTNSEDSWITITQSPGALTTVEKDISFSTGTEKVTVLKGVGGSGGGNGTWQFLTGKDFLPIGKYNITFKLAVEGSFEASDKLNINLKRGGTTTALKSILLRDVNDISSGATASSYTQTVEVDIRNKSDVIQFLRVQGVVAEVVYLWDFEIPIESEKLVFPEMLPAHLFSGSTDAYGHETGRGAPGDTREFFRDIHNTPFDKRLVAPGFVQPGLAHEETELLNKSVRNSPVSLSKDTDILGGTITPFNDAHPLARIANTPAVAADVNTDFSQRVGDHFAVVIELDPSEETTIGVERGVDGLATGRVTSMAYYNFDTKRWETSGNNNDFVIPGAITINTSSATAVARGIADAQVMNNELMPHTCELEILRNSVELFQSTSVGFTGTSGFTIYPNLGKESLSDLKNRALPTSNYGFPGHKKYEPKSGQKIKMSDHISEPFILERVSFEYGAAIEESGPHSLGYKLPFISSENPDYRILYPQIVHKTTRWKSSVDNPQSSNASPSVVNYDQAQLRRGEFINGSPALNLGDVATGFAGASDSSFTTAKATPVNMLINACRGAGTAISTNTEDTLGYFASYAGSAGGDGNSSQIQFSNHVATQFKGKEGLRRGLLPNETAGLGGGQDYSLMTVTASMFLKTTSGPRTPAEDPTKRTLTDVASSRTKAVTAIPVLAGGMNGVVTGSWLSSGLNFGDPVLGLFTNDADNGSDDTNRSWYSSEGGTPFWRADTFFLLKEKVKPDVHESFPIKIVASSWAPFFCGIPYAPQDNIASSADDIAPGAGQNGVQQVKAAYSQFRTMGNGQSASKDVDITQVFRYGARASSALLRNPPVGSDTGGIPGAVNGTTLPSPDVDSFGNLEIDVGSRSSRTREIVTFGQMVHYGYANAATELTGTLVDTVAEFSKTQTPTMSASIDPTFSNEIFDSVGNTPRKVSLNSQALKIRSLFQGYGYTSVPANLEHIYDASKDGTSVFSDFPDTCQSQYGSPTDPIALTSDYSFRVTPAQGAPKTRFESESGLGAESYRRPPSAPHPRYALSGSKFGGSGYNETFVGLDTWTSPLVLTAAGVRPGADATGKGAAIFASYYRDNSTGTGDRPNSGTAGNNALALQASSPQGSGLSLISSPAYIASEKRLSGVFLTGSMAEDFARFGSFSTEAAVWQQDLGRKFSSAPDKTWLDSGLRRDLNILLQPGQTHQGTNIDFPDSFCGFTIMTASTAQRPYESPGRESAALPLQSNVYKRQYLNYRNDFKIDVPVRANVPRSAETPGYWTFTTNNYRTQISGFASDRPEQTHLESLGGTLSSGDPVAPAYDNTDPAGFDNKRATFQRALYAKRFHLRYSIVVGEGGWDPQILKTTKRYVRSAVAFEPESATSQSSLGLPGMSGFSAGPRGFGIELESTVASYSIDDQNPSSTPGFGVRPPRIQQAFTNTINATETSGSFAKDPTVDSMYILEPEDELVLGVQPALPGWNPGSGLPNNRHSSKYGIWDDKGSRTAGHALAWDVDATGHVVRNPYMNLEDPYEPCHGLTMLKTPSRVVLYGTFVRDNKPYDNSSTEIIGSDAIHEALHFDNPVLDQFNLASTDEYVGSGLEQHVTGTMAATGPDTTAAQAAKLRGVANRISDGTMSISGSLRRQVRLSESDEIYFDTLLQDPSQIARALNGTVDLAPVATGRTFVNMHYAVKENVEEQAGYLAYYRAQQNSNDTGALLCAGWSDSFPFESKFSEVQRSTQRLVPGFQAGQELEIFLGAIDPPDGPYGSTGAPDVGGFPTEPFNYITALSGSANRIYNPRRRLADGKFTFGSMANASITSANPALIGTTVRHLRNMANVKSVSDRRTIDVLGGNNFRKNDDLTYRFFAAQMVGYGRENRKYLDARDFAETRALGVTVVGVAKAEADFDHPAGFKFGYMNCDHLSPSAVYRSDRYGQFRDMLEQRLYTKTYSRGGEFSSEGESEAAVSCIFVGRDGLPVDDSTLTTCLNLSTAMTASKPFCEGETPARTIVNIIDFVNVNPFSIDLDISSLT